MDADRPDVDRQTVDRQNTDKQSLGEIISSLFGDISTLFRQEVDLAKTEMTQKASRAAKDAVGAIVGAVVAIFGVNILLWSLIYGLTNFMPLWLSALIVGGVITLIGAIVLINGIKDIQDIDPAPERTVRTLKEDAQFAKEKINNG